MQYSWHFQYSSTLINLGRDNMFSLVSLFFFFLFLHIVFLVFAACFFMCRRHKGLAATAARERDISGSPA